MVVTNRDVLEVVFGRVAVDALEANGPYALRDEATFARINERGNCAIGEVAEVVGMGGVSATPTSYTVVRAASRVGAVAADELVDLERMVREITIANDGGRFRDRDSIAIYLDSPVQIGTKLRRRVESSKR